MSAEASAERREIRLDRLTWPEFNQRVRDESPVVIVPVGSTEQHGPHMPLGCDVAIPVAVADRVAEVIGGLVAPAIPYGYKSQPKTGGGNHFPGTLSLDASTLIAVLRDLTNELARHGVRRIVILDGHMENQWFITEAIDLALRDNRREGIRDLKVVKLGYWEFIDARTEALLFPDGLISWALEHAAVMETSVMLHLHPELVRRDRIPDHPAAEFPPYDVFPVDRRPIPPDGVLTSAAAASPSKGEAVLAQIVPDIARALRREFGLGRPGESRPTDPDGVP